MFIDILLAELFLSTRHTSRMKLPYVTDLLSRVDEEERKDSREGTGEQIEDEMEEEEEEAE